MFLIFKFLDIYTSKIEIITFEFSIVQYLSSSLVAGRTRVYRFVTKTLHLNEMKRIQYLERGNVHCSIIVRDKFFSLSDTNL